MAFDVDIKCPAPGWTISDWRRATQTGALQDEPYLAFFEQLPRSDPAWIYRASRDEIQEQLRSLRSRDESGLALYGVPFAVKDNIDVQGWPTTAACPSFAYVAPSDAHVVQRLRAAGAICVGKTNLDQFASGLVGTRSPYGVVPNTFQPEFIAGGSSSGSASVVARGLVPVALGTDTAGSGRVPAAFNNIVGWKPSRGVLSTRGLVPACRTLDCVSIFALTLPDAERVFELLLDYDAADPYARRFPQEPPRYKEQRDWRWGVPEPLNFFGDETARAAFDQTLQAVRAQGIELSPVDFTPFAELAQLLYQSSWVAERALVAKRVLSGPAEAMDPTVRGILLYGAERSAEQAFEDEYRRAELARQINTALGELDALIVPTTPTIYRIDEVRADPIGTNSRLGSYTNFTNLADLSALALPGMMRSDGLPAGITLLGPAFADRRLAHMGQVLEARVPRYLGATARRLDEVPAPARGEAVSVAAASQWVEVAVVGAHLSGMPLNHQLTSRGARLARSTTTAARYRLYALSGSSPPKPGLERREEGEPIAVEVWCMPIEQLGSFVQEIPPPLCMGNVELVDGTWVKGFLCEHEAIRGAEDITRFGGFKQYLAARASSAVPVDSH